MNLETSNMNLSDEYRDTVSGFEGNITLIETTPTGHQHLDGSIYRTVVTLRCADRELLGVPLQDLEPVSPVLELTPVDPGPLPTGTEVTHYMDSFKRGVIEVIYPAFYVVRRVDGTLFTLNHCDAAALDS